MLTYSTFSIPLKTNDNLVISLTELQTSLHILCIGDSHTAGYLLFDPLYGGDSQSSYEFWLHKDLRRKFPHFQFVIENRGICGQTAPEVLSRLRIILDQNHPDLVVFWAGANDLAMGYSANQIWEDLWGGFELSQTHGVTFCLVTIPPMDFEGLTSTLTQLNQKINDNTKGNYLCADVYKPLVHDGRLDKVFSVGDGAHLSIQGYKEVGELIFATIAPFISKYAIY